MNGQNGQIKIMVIQNKNILIGTLKNFTNELRKNNKYLFEK